MRLPQSSFLCLAIAFLGCATTRDRASELFSRGEFEASAEAYDALLREHPEQKDLVLRRDTARARALVQRADEVRALHLGGRVAEALAAADQLLSRSDAWSPLGQDQARSAVAREASWADQHLRTEVDHRLQAREPLGAQAMLETHAALLGRTPLVETHRELTGAVQRAGQEHCARLATAAGDGAPYWSVLVGRYCEHFGVERASSTPVLPDQYGGLAFQGGVTGVGRPQFMVLACALARAFEGSAWYAPGARARTADLSGSFAAQVRTEHVRREAPWTEQVPYHSTEQVMEPHQVPYTETEYRSEQVPYTDTEHYTVQVPYTDTEHYTYSCGFGTNHRTCSGTRTVTRHRSESRTRTVTKYRSEMRPHLAHKTRTEYRPVWKTVTRYRSEPRVFTYDADQVSADYQAALAVHLAGAVPVETRVEDALKDQGDLHDAEHAPSHVRPQRPGFPPPEHWFEAQAEQLAQRLGAELASAWRESFCAPVPTTLEAASRCLHGHPEAQGLEATFAPALGGDASAFIQRVRRPTSP